MSTWYLRFDAYACMYVRMYVCVEKESPHQMCSILYWNGYFEPLAKCCRPLHQAALNWSEFLEFYIVPAQRRAGIPIGPGSSFWFMLDVGT